jgi:DNA-binding NarL/FixJ family response regulator
MADKKAVILIVEDEADINEAYQIVLKSAGYDVISAANGEEALKVTKKIEPNLILLDLRMPQKDGIEFLREFDAQKHPAVKVIIFSNYDMQEEIQKAYDLGAQGYVLKAEMSPKELEEIVKDNLK